MGGWPANQGTAELNQLFTSLGFTVVKSNLLPDKKGYGFCGGFVHVASADEATAAIGALNGQPLQWAPAQNKRPLEMPGVLQAGTTWDVSDLKRRKLEPMAQQWW